MGKTSITLEYRCHPYSCPTIHLNFRLNIAFDDVFHRKPR